MTKKILVVLISNGVSDRSQRAQQERALTMLNSEKVPFVTVDGMDPDQRERRNSLFETSAIYGKYPQLFFQHTDGSIEFLGDYEELEALNETRTMSQDVLKAYPDLKTWEKTFRDVVNSF